MEEGKAERLPGSGADGLALRRSQESSPGMMNISAAQQH